jgi:hypothetical protein
LIINCRLTLTDGDDPTSTARVTPPPDRDDNIDTLIDNDDDDDDNVTPPTLVLAIDDIDTSIRNTTIDDIRTSLPDTVILDPTNNNVAPGILDSEDEDNNDTTNDNLVTQIVDPAEGATGVSIVDSSDETTIVDPISFREPLTGAIIYGDEPTVITSESEGNNTARYTGTFYKR